MIRRLHVLASGLFMVKLLTMIMLSFSDFQWIAEAACFLGKSLAVLEIEEQHGTIDAPPPLSATIKSLKVKHRPISSAARAPPSTFMLC